MELRTGPDRKNLYTAFCEQQGNVPAFLHPWWLDLDAGEENWDVVLAEANGHIMGALPFCTTRMKFFRGIGMPPVAPYQGYHIVYPPDQRKGASKITWEQKTVQLLFSGLPDYAFFYQHFPPEITNWIPLYWLGFKQTTRYSYLLDNLGQTDEIFAGFEKRARNTIRKAEKKLVVAEETNGDVLLDLTRLTYQKQRLRPPYDLSRLASLSAAVINRKAGKIYAAKDDEGKPHAAAFAVWDQGRAYYIIQSSDPAFLTDGGAALLVWHAIKDASANGLTVFDFTGSMMPNVEKYIRSFGALPVQRHYITKENSVLFYWLTRFKSFLDDKKMMKV